MAEFPAMMLWTDAYLSDTTHLRTDEDKIAMIPNGLLSNSVIVNVTRGQR